MELSKYKIESQDFSKAASDIVRNFAFAGIAIIWIFKNDSPAEPLIPSDLLPSLFFIIVSLILDLLQYFIPSLIWIGFFRYHEMKNKGKTDVDVKANSWLTVPGYLCYFGKIITLGIAYYYMLGFLTTKLHP